MQRNNNTTSSSPLFSDTFRSVYNDMATNNSPPHPDLESGELRYGEKKYGIKTLLSQRSKMIYPFAKSNNVSEKDNFLPEPRIDEKKEPLTLGNVENKETMYQITNYTDEVIKDASKLIEENKSKKDQTIEFINESKNVIEEVSKLVNKSNVISSLPDANKCVNECLTNNINSPIIERKMSENIEKKTDSKEIDIVTSSNEEKHNMEEKNTSQSMEPSKESQKKVDNAEDNTEDSMKWNPLEVDDLIISFKVVSKLPPSTKLKIVNNTHFAIEDRYFVGLARRGDSRKKNVSFMKHLFAETEKNAYSVLEKIRRGVDVDDNVGILFNMMYNLSIFLHNFETMRSVYADDSSTHAELGNVRDKFFRFGSTFFREMTVPKASSH